MKDFFYAIQDLFVDVLFAPFDALRALELESWFAANIVSWIFTLLVLLLSLLDASIKKYNDNNEEDKSISAHSYL